MNWREHRIIADGEELICLHASSAFPPRVDAPRTLVVVPYFDGVSPRDGKGEGYLRRLAENMTARGAGVLFYGGRYAQLPDLHAALVASRDAFSEADRRTYGVLAGCLDQGLADPGGLVLLGISRFGFASLHALGHPELAPRAGVAPAAVIASSPVVHWPVLAEYADLEGSAILAAHDLAALVPRFPPTPMLLQIGESDDRVSTPRVVALGETIAAEYAAVGVGERFELRLLPVPGHQTTREFWLSAVDWLTRRELLAAI